MENICPYCKITLQKVAGFLKTSKWEQEKAQNKFNADIISYNFWTILCKRLAIGNGRCNLLPLLQSVLGYSVELELSEASRSLLLICLIEPQRVNELDRRFELLNKRRECRRSSRPDTGKVELRFVVRAYMILSFGLPTKEL
jgi:hypothetical protein